MKVISVNVSRSKGTIKLPVPEIRLTKTGVEGDAHAGAWHRQVSLLAKESFERFEKIAGRLPAWGEFAENITTEGLVLHACRPLDRLRIGEALLEVTQIGKKCHGDSCAIFREVGSCVMPKEGIFCRVIEKGIVKPGDGITYLPKNLKVLVITLSDRAFSGEYTDRSGPLIVDAARNILSEAGWEPDIKQHLLPDDASQLTKLITEESGHTDIIFITGGTGIGPRDITTDTLKPLLDKEIPGIMDHIRLKYGGANPNALISRSIAGLRNSTMVFALPGSVKAVTEYMEEIGKVLAHLIYMVHGIDSH